MKEKPSISFFWGVNVDSNEDLKIAFLVWQTIWKLWFDLKHWWYGWYMEETAKWCNSVWWKCISVDLKGMNWWPKNQYVDDIITCNDTNARFKEYWICDVIIIYNWWIWTLYEALHFIHHFIIYPKDRKPILLMWKRTINLFKYLEKEWWVTHSLDRDISYVKYIYNIDEFNYFMENIWKK